MCGCLKAFCKDLREPIVTFALWSRFVEAAQLNDADERNLALYQAVSELPQANRDTLAYMMRHLQR